MLRISYSFAGDSICGWNNERQHIALPLQAEQQLTSAVGSAEQLKRALYIYGICR